MKELIAISKQLNELLDVACEKLGVEVTNTSFMAYDTMKKENLISLMEDQNSILNTMQKINYENENNST